MIGNDSRYRLVGQAATVAAAIEMARRLEPEILLIDLGLPDGTGTEVLRAVHDLRVRPLALVLTVFDDAEHVFDALRAGAIGYLLKEDVATRLLSFIDEVCAGGAPMSSTIARRVLTSFAEPSAEASVTREAALTAREREVTELLADGASYDEIGRTLGISTNTGRGFIRLIYDKLHVCSKTEAVREAVRLGYLHLPRGR